MTEAKSIYRYMMAFQGLFVCIRSKPTSDYNIILLRIFCKYLSYSEISENEIRSLINDITNNTKVDGDIKEYLCQKLQRNNGDEVFKDDRKYWDYVSILRSLSEEICVYIEKKEFEKVCDLADAIHNFPEFLVTNTWNSIDFWNAYIKPYNKKWKSNLLIDWSVKQKHRGLWIWLKQYLKGKFKR